MHVAAIVVTYRRPHVLTTTLRAISEQTRAPDEILVVDNDTSALAIAAEMGAGYVRTGDNLGPAAAFARGMATLGHADWYWLLDDDSHPAPHALENCLDHVAADVGAVGYVGGNLRLGNPRPVISSEPRNVQYLLCDGALVNRAAVIDAGVPRADFFIMYEDIEFTNRIHEAGWQLVVLPDALERLHLGAANSRTSWRAYYQTRNQLRRAIDRRSAKLVLGWAARTTKLVMADMRSQQSRDGAAMRLKGAADALMGRMGRTVEPQ